MRSGGLANYGLMTRQYTPVPPSPAQIASSTTAPRGSLVALDGTAGETAQRTRACESVLRALLEGGRDPRRDVRCIRLCGIGLVVPLLSVSSCFETVTAAAGAVLPPFAAC